MADSNPSAGALMSGIMRYELLLMWRRNALNLLLLTLLVAPIILIGFYRVTNDPMPALDTSNRITSVSMLATAGVLPGILILLPLVFADTFAQDRHHQMRELLFSLPISRTRYIAGKLLTIWAICSLTALVSAVLIMAACRLLLGVYDLSGTLPLWLAGISPIILLNSSVGALLPANQTTRMRAIWVGLALVPVSFGIYLNSPLMHYYMTAAALGLSKSDHMSAEILHYLPTAGFIASTFTGSLILVLLAWINTWFSLRQLD